MNDDNKPGRMWLIGAAALVAAFLIWVGMYYQASGHIGRFWE